MTNNSTYDYVTICYYMLLYVTICYYMLLYDYVTHGYLIVNLI